MRWSLSLLALSSIYTFAIAGETPAPFPLFGLWHSVSATAPNGRDINLVGGGLELEFLPDNVLIETVPSPSRTGGGRPIRVRCGYAFQPPNMVSYTYKRGGRITTQQQRFRVDGDVVTFENTQSGMITKMRRITHSQFKTAQDVPELPK